jgi:hypothetical protein
MRRSDTDQEIGALGQMEKMLKPGGFALLVVVVFGAVIVAGFGSSAGPVHVANTSYELGAVKAATAHIAENAKYRHALGRTPGIEDRWFSYVVSFPPACSLSGRSGPIVTVAKGSYRVVHAVMEHAVCMDDSPGWLAESGHATRATGSPSPPRVAP